MHTASMQSTEVHEWLLAFDVPSEYDPQEHSQSNPFLRVPSGTFHWEHGGVPTDQSRMPRGMLGCPQWNALVFPEERSKRSDFGDAPSVSNYCIQNITLLLFDFQFNSPT